METGRLHGCENPAKAYSDTCQQERSMATGPGAMQRLMTDTGAGVEEIAQ
jgi:hypothetical protein